MVDNQGNTFGAAPDKGEIATACNFKTVSSEEYNIGLFNGPVTTASNITLLHNVTKLYQKKKRQGTDYWISELGSLGSVWSRFFEN